MLTEKGEEGEIQEDNGWFVEKIRIVVSEFDTNDNEQFLSNFVEFYEKVSSNLIATKKFNIKYKAIFFFEQWIND